MPKKRKRESRSKRIEFPIMTLLATLLKKRALRFQRRSQAIKEHSIELVGELQKNMVNSINPRESTKTPNFVV